MQVKVAGMVWYKPENFSRLIAMFEDGKKLHGSYKEWLRDAERGRKKLEADGVRVVCVDIDPNQFPEWCRANGMKLNAEARNKFASLMAYKVVTGVQDGGGVH